MINWAGQLRRGISGFARACRNLLLPPRCVCCDREFLDCERNGDRPFCAKCLTRVGPETWYGCRRCGAAVPDDGFSLPDCYLCRRSSLRFDAAVILGSYHGALREIVLRMKRPSHEGLTRAIGRMFSQRRGEPLTAHRVDLIVPVPMFWRRRLIRGINSPDVLAHCLGRSLGISLQRNLLVRCRNTRPQAELSPSRRFENMQGAFRVRHPRTAKNARILLVDDILTTGATCSEAAKMLKQAGAASVVVAVVARAGER